MSADNLLAVDYDAQNSIEALIKYVVFRSWQPSTGGVTLTFKASRIEAHE
jgi:hypothetical protein